MYILAAHHPIMIQLQVEWYFSFVIHTTVLIVYKGQVEVLDLK